MRTVPIVMLLALSAAHTHAADHPQAAAQLSLKATGNRQMLRWSTRVPSPGLPGSNPSTLGAMLAISGANGETTTFNLPAAGWSAASNGTTYVFKNAAAPGGISSVRSVRLKQGKVLQVVAKSVGITLDEPTQGTVRIALTIGDDVYCSACTAASRDRPGSYAARRCPAPANCSGPTPTATPTPTSTAVCGNNVAETPGEDCDGSDPGVCAQFPPPFPIACDDPGSPTPCKCCGISDCLIQPGGATLCCGGAVCQDVTGAGQIRSGTCIPPTCAEAADCNGYQCVAGSCCGDAGDLCGAVDCCPGSGATCSTVGWIGARVCCRASGAACSVLQECCSGACTAGLCE